MMLPPLFPAILVMIMCSDIDDLPPPIHSSASTQLTAGTANNSDNTAATTLGEIKGLIENLLTKVSANERAINALKEQIQ